jgi:aspartate carbamoyltransferase catalytic subunit
MNIAHKSTFVLGGRHLLGIERLSYSDIIGLLDLAEEFVELNCSFFVSNLASD